MTQIEIIPQDIALATELAPLVGNADSGARLAAEVLGYSNPAEVAATVCAPEHAAIRNSVGDLALGAALARQSIGLRVDGERG